MSRDYERERKNVRVIGVPLDFSAVDTVSCEEFRN